MDEQDRDFVESLVSAYRQGCFPMADPESGLIRWYRPDPRAIIPLDGFRVPDTLRRRVRSGRFTITTNYAFSNVIRACAVAAPGREETWIDAQLVTAYEALHRAGHAHSVEAWLENNAAAHRHEGATAGDESRHGAEAGEGMQLVGGLYGVQVGGLFAGESMFSRPERGGTDASKVCLVHLVNHLRRRGFAILDVQFPNPHLEQFGVVEISCEAYLSRLTRAVESNISWKPFEPDLDVSSPNQALP